MEYKLKLVKNNDNDELINLKYTLPEFKDIKDINAHYENIFKSLVENKSSFPDAIFSDINLKVKEEYEQAVKDYYEGLTEEARIRSIIKKQKISNYRSLVKAFTEKEVLKRSEFNFDRRKKMRPMKYERFRNWLLDTKLSMKTFWKCFRLLLISFFFDTRFEKNEVKSLKKQLKQITKGEITTIEKLVENEPLDVVLSPFELSKEKEDNSSKEVVEEFEEEFETGELEPF